MGLKRPLTRNYTLLFDTYFYRIKINIFKKLDFGPKITKIQKMQKMKKMKKIKKCKKVKKKNEKNFFWLKKGFLKNGPFFKFYVWPFVMVFFL